MNDDLDFALTILERIAQVFDGYADEVYTGAEIARCMRGCSVAICKDNDLTREDS